MTHRAIKYRVWDTSKRQMQPVKSIHFGDDGSALTIVIDVPGPYSAGLVLGENAVLLQYTGLLDIYSKEIYEGDIIIGRGYPFFDEGVLNYVATVEWIYSQWQAVTWCVNPDKRGISNGINEGVNDAGTDEGEVTAWEVIGNRYEHPQLLPAGWQDGDYSPG